MWIYIVKYLQNQRMYDVSQMKSKVELFKEK